MSRGSSLKYITAAFLLFLLGFSLINRPISSYVQAAEGSVEMNLHPTEIFSAPSSARTIIEAFQLSGVAYYPEDIVTAFPDPSLGLGSVVTVQRALSVEITEGKKTYILRTWQETVGEMLADKKIELGEEDRISPSPDTVLTLGSKVVITRVARTVVSELETIPFESREVENPNLWRGERTVSQDGENGQREKKYLLVREDGELVSKTLVSNSIIKQMVAKITQIGTKLRIGKTYSGRATYYENNYGTKVATDMFKKGTELRVTNLNNGKSIIVRNDGCICGATGVLIDLNPAYFQQLGGTLAQGVLQNVRVEEILP